MPIFEDNGSGKHTHQSLWKGGEPLFACGGYAGLSQTALWYIGGLIKHGPALAAIIAPTTNSYERLVPGFEAPVNLALLAPQPPDAMPYSDVFGIAKDEARRIPTA